jgi:hypothetical protein
MDSSVEIIRLPPLSKLRLVKLTAICDTVVRLNTTDGAGKGLEGVEHKVSKADLLVTLPIALNATT